MHVSMNYFQAHRPRDLVWTVPAENFSHILSIYGGHFMDMLFHVVGAPQGFRNKGRVLTLDCAEEPGVFGARLDSSEELGF